MDGGREIAIVGVYATRQERKSGRTTLSLVMEAIHGALADAGIPMSEVDGLTLRSGFSAGNGTGIDAGEIAYQFGQPFTFTAEASGAKAELMAAAAIRDGIANVVICPGGASNSAVGTMAALTRARPTSSLEWDRLDDSGPVRHGRRAATCTSSAPPIEQMAEVAANSHHTGRLNPEAVRFG